MNQFKCTSCGKCCSDFGEQKTLPLFDFEKNIYEKLANNLHLTISFTPENTIQDDISNTLFCANWGMNIMPCPFLSNTNKCRIYEHRALICKAFPIEKVKKTRWEFGKSCFMKCANLDSTKVVLEAPDNDIEKYLTTVFGKECVNARKIIKEFQEDISKKIFKLQKEKKIKLKVTSIQPFEYGAIIGVDEFLKSLE